MRKILIQIWMFKMTQAVNSSLKFKCSNFNTFLKLILFCSVLLFAERGNSYILQFKLCKLFCVFMHCVTKNISR
jgi:hypothetical protein